VFPDPRAVPVPPPAPVPVADSTSFSPLFLLRPSPKSPDIAKATFDLKVESC